MLELSARVTELSLKGCGLLTVRFRFALALIGLAVQHLQLSRRDDLECLAQARGLAVQFQGRHHVLRYPCPALVQLAQADLRRRVTLLGGTLVPRRRHGEVRGAPQALLVNLADVGLGLRVALFGER